MQGKTNVYQTSVWKPERKKFLNYLNYFEQIEWKCGPPLWSHYFSENLVAPGIEPRLPDL
jgi:hypothetical protein